MTQKYLKLWTSTLWHQTLILFILGWCEARRKWGPNIQAQTGLIWYRKPTSTFTLKMISFAEKSTWKMELRYFKILLRIQTQNARGKACSNPCSPGTPPHLSPLSQACQKMRPISTNLFQYFNWLSLFSLFYLNSASFRQYQLSSCL